MPLTPASSRPVAAGAKLRNSVVQSIANATETNLSFDTVLYDTDGFYSAAAPTRLTIPVGKDGRYLAGTSLEFASNAVGRRLYILYLNGTEPIAVSQTSAVSAGDSEGCLTAVWNAAAGDFITSRVLQSSGAALNVQAYASNPQIPTLWLERLT